MSNKFSESFNLIVLNHVFPSGRMQRVNLGTFPCASSGWEVDGLIRESFSGIDDSIDILITLPQGAVSPGNVPQSFFVTKGGSSVIVQLRSRDRTLPKSHPGVIHGPDPIWEMIVTYHPAGDIPNYDDGQGFSGPQLVSSFSFTGDGTLADLCERMASLARAPPQSLYFGFSPGYAWPFDFASVLDFRFECQRMLCRALCAKNDLPGDVIKLIASFTPYCEGRKHRFGSLNFSEGDRLSGALSARSFLTEKGFPLADTTPSPDDQGQLKLSRRCQVYTWPREIEIELFFGSSQVRSNSGSLFGAVVAFPRGRLFDIENFLFRATGESTEHFLARASGDGSGCKPHMPEAAEFRGRNLLVRINDTPIFDSKCCLGQLHDSTVGRCTVVVSLSADGGAVSSSPTSRISASIMAEEILHDRDDRSSRYDEMGFLNVGSPPFLTNNQL
jgi:hypothetical protein